MTAIHTALGERIGWREAAGAVLVAFVAGVIVFIAMTARAGSPIQPSRNGDALAITSNPNIALVAAYRQTVANLAYAERRHDGASVAQFQVALVHQMTPETIQALYAENTRLLANLTAARARHDQRMILSLRQELAALCPATMLDSAPAFCR
jgi:hypothetical protein